MESQLLKKMLVFGTMNVAAFMFSQNAVTDTVSTRSKSIDEVVITGNSNPKASIKTSTSISTLKSADIINSAPRTTAEIFRTIPGIRAESSGGEGNSNITVRGVPVSAGGSRYLLIQEDGLPVMQFGDIAFGTQDQFTRFDSFVSRVEALRGGSASVFASNSPAGIINFITKTGEKEGGSITQQVGLNYKNFRTDIDYGTALGKDFYIGVGGFYRGGDGPRKTGYTSNNGGQFRLSLLKKFEKGSIRVYGKYLDDRTAAYMPMPIAVSGSDSNPEYSSLNNYNILTGALQSSNFRNDVTLGANGQILKSDIRDGMHSGSKTVGFEFNYDFGSGWKLDAKARYAANDGQFLAPFPASVGSKSEILESVTGYGSAVYAGTNTAVDSNAKYMKTVLFNTKMNNLNNFFSDVNISKKWNKVKLNTGVYNSSQNINLSWNWNTYLMEVSDNNSRLVDVLSTTGTKITDNGLLNYGVPAFGGVNRIYDTKYSVIAPHAQVEINPVEKLTLDIGARYDFGNVTGSFSGTQNTKRAININQNGTLETPELAVEVVNGTVPVDYQYGIFGYSFGANYTLNSRNAIFARVSQGGSASADRILLAGYNYTNNDDPALDAVKVNKLNQIEVGYKLRGSNYFLNTTLFQARTIEANYEATTQLRTENKYESFGVEFDGFYKFNKNFDIKAGLTYTHAEIKNAIDKTIIGNIPRRTPKFMYSFNPNVNIEKLSFGFFAVGSTKAFTQDSNKLIMPGYVIVNPYISYRLLKNLTVNVNANNVFNSLAITEAEEGTLEGTNGIIRARTLPGRTFGASVKFDF
ncbi:TonB-dependent receptor [Chryseobacterium sp. Ch-15]|uniref:TonB-dependent receptor n=1 Tax=Chryseobacterium muglaense TaxID=2893752 RepID=A0A9Q3UR00_9FLAO|nr:TonB-dependent receptor [Chryseobacterium muglaense]MBD3906060.1 TonB-dependent receptor [Chryseobacterium muglaense]MCC9033002.1 TonB-dependent receptor [Chryseobacterium muglaense]MCM2556897.1 TonB-dependent receptor [Chryseobacterium muglaense]